MFSVFLSACVLSLLTVYTHASGIALLMRRLPRSGSLSSGAWAVRRTLLRIVWWLVVLHLAEISIWGLFYQWRGFFPDAESAFYFSASTYTTLGYGDVLLAKPWRMLGPIESLMGVLMFGLSTGYFFLVVGRLYQSWPARVNPEQ
jgi:ion channel